MIKSIHYYRDRMLIIFTSTSKFYILECHGNQPRPYEVFELGWCILKSLIVISRIVL